MKNLLNYCSKIENMAQIYGFLAFVFIAWAMIRFFVDIYGLLPCIAFLMFGVIFIVSVPGIASFLLDSFYKEKEDKDEIK